MILGGVAALLVGSTVWLAVLVHGQHARNSNRDAALGRAQQIITDYATYDYQHVDAQLQHLGTELRGPLKTQQDQARSAIVKFLQQGKATAKSQVVSIAVNFQTGNQVSVTAVVDQTVVNTALPKGKLNRYRFHVVLSKDHGHWYATTLDPQA
ncbi:MAG: hypothetical protein ACJ735_18050 [Actinomycetes bacterium]